MQSRLNFTDTTQALFAYFVAKLACGDNFLREAMLTAHPDTGIAELEKLINKVMIGNIAIFFQKYLEESESLAKWRECDRRVSMVYDELNRARHNQFAVEACEIKLTAAVSQRTFAALSTTIVELDYVVVNMLRRDFDAEKIYEAMTNEQAAKLIHDTVLAVTEQIGAIRVKRIETRYRIPGKSTPTEIELTPIKPNSASAVRSAHVVYGGQKAPSAASAAAP